jgi:hypothetical protein
MGNPAPVNRSQATMKAWILATLISCSFPAWPQSEPLGRLFFTPQQRALLDRQRIQGMTSNFDQQASYTLNGEVRRSSGKNTRWINGEAQTGPTPRGVIGDTYHPATGERDSLLGGGKIHVQNPALKP